MTSNCCAFWSPYTHLPSHQFPSVNPYFLFCLPINYPKTSKLSFTDAEWSNGSIVCEEPNWNRWRNWKDWSNYELAKSCLDHKIQCQLSVWDSTEPGVSMLELSAFMSYVYDFISTVMSMSLVHLFLHIIHFRFRVYDVDSKYHKTPVKVPCNTIFFFITLWFADTYDVCTTSITLSIF